MDQQRGDCDLVFPHQDHDDGHAFVLWGSRDCVSFHLGEGKGGEVNKLSGDGLDVGGQLKLICQFCQNPHLKHLRVDSKGFGSWGCDWGTLSYLDHACLIWTTLMRELQRSASLEYIEFWELPYSSRVCAL